MARLSSLKDVVDWRLCIGCGACAVACRHDGVEMEFQPEEGFRPRFSEKCANCAECLEFCPGYRLDATNIGGNGEAADFGPARQIWEGWAADPEIRYRGSSGGVLTALALYGIEEGGLAGVVQTGPDPEDPTRNRTVVSTSREEVLACAGSRYNASAPAAGVRDLRDRPGQYLFIGKPCDAAAVMVLRRLIPWVQERIAAVATFFCAGTPAPSGTRQLVEHLGGDPTQVVELHYRGEGWPGEFRFRDGKAGKESKRLSYEASWGFLTGFRPLRCHLCPDGTGQIADLACGDAWHRYRVDRRDPGRSLVLVRTDLGQQYLEQARRAGYVELHASDRRAVVAGQSSLLGRRRELAGRLAALRILHIPVPHYIGFQLRRTWRHLPWRRRIRVVLGTLRRALLRGWFRPNRT